VAESSTFEGERQNALAAATRLAARFGLSLAEAAAGRGAPPRPEPQPEARRDAAWRAEFARFVHMTDYQIQLDKARRDAALRDALRRGLDAEERKAAARNQTKRSRPSRVRMDPQRHAHTLLRETSLRFREIAEITGLSVYQVVGMKLKMRVLATDANWFESAGQSG